MAMPRLSSSSNSPSLTLSIQLSTSSSPQQQQLQQDDHCPQQYSSPPPPPPPMPLEFLPLRPSPQQFQPWRSSTMMTMMQYSSSPNLPDSLALPLRGIIDMNQMPSATSSDSEDDIDLSSSAAPPHLRLSVRRLPVEHDQQQDYYYHGADLAKPNSEAEHMYMERIRHETLFPPSDEEDGGVGSVRKKLRLSKEQSAVLEESFKEHSTLNPKQKNALAKQLNLRPRQVEVWFQNRRARTKLKQTEVDCKLLKRCCESLTEENRRLQREVAELRAMKVGGGGHDFYKSSNNNNSNSNNTNNNNNNSNRGMKAAAPAPAPAVAAATLTMCPCCEQLATTSSSSAAAAAASSSSSAAAAAAAASTPNSNFPFIPKPYFPLSSISPQQQSSAAC